MTKNITTNADFSKNSGLLPAIIQDSVTREVLMLGYMNREALEKSFETKKVWFFSRSKNRLWMKGEESGNILEFQDAKLDCDNDTILIQAIPKGPTCHTGTSSCFGENKKSNIFFLEYLFELLQDRKKKLPKNSYTAELFQSGLKRICEKVEEESGEVIEAAKNETSQRIIEESADLIFHLLVLLSEKDITIQQVVEELKKRH
ncbi:bifunctional phosphoribosyl-AMP cyclohydrolase/phosphoribosyl-ATP diphosphatase HisIE [Candidatus Peregrinibacteria bacterium]|nr:bifunctional phosphoribosyl-AMP cyclohydrolase/phosphoribosyl-ATP diphosphatase HisIE [Candidatus Peregrinibacteria bacterium]